jgi:transcriptional regulator with XRE-family HTH domain
MSGEELKKKRLEKGLSQYELADAIGVTQSRIWLWESDSHKISRAYQFILKQYFNK